MATGEFWSPLHARFHQLLRQRQLLPIGQRILVAVSGGQDSLCLMQLLLDLQPKWGWELAIAHCNHGWRADADANADHVAKLAQHWGVPDFSQRATNLPVTEAAARQWRYTVLADLVYQHDYACVVTGHTASDRAETLLYNLVRGSGSDGLQALTWVRTLVMSAGQSLRVVRPLLGVSRVETGTFCRDRHLPIWPDTTNDSRHYARNRIRHDVLPYLTNQLNPQAEAHLAQTAELLQAEVDYLETVTQEWWDHLLQTALGFQRSGTTHGTEGSDRPNPDHRDQTSPFPLHCPTLRQLPLAIQRRIIRRWLHHQLGINPSFNQIEKLVALIDAPRGHQTDPFPQGAIARVVEDWITLLRPTP